MLRIEVIAKDKSKTEIGRGMCPQFDSMEEAQKVHGLGKCLTDLNRQIKTDFRNDLAREKSTMAQLSKMSKNDPKIEAEMKKILEREMKKLLDAQK